VNAVLKLIAICSSYLFVFSAMASSVSGYIYEHYNFGGNQETYDPHSSDMIEMWRMDIEVELKETGAWFPKTYSASTGTNGHFSFRNIPDGTYILSLPSTRGSDQDGDIYSERGDCYDCLPVQVWPNITEDYTRTVVVNGSDVNDAHLGFNYSSVINEQDKGKGSLRQFLVNSQDLTTGRDYTWLTKARLAQKGHTPGVDNAIFAKPISSIVLNSPLEFIDSERTYIDARMLLSGSRPLSITNFRSQPINEDYGLKVTNSYAFIVAGINWNRFDDAIYVRDSHGVQLVDNSFNDTRDSGAIIYDSQDIVVSDNLFNNTVNKEDHNEQAAGLYLSRSDRVSVLRNQFVDTGDDHMSDGKHSWHVSGVRVLYGNENTISQNTFQNTKGMAIDLRYVEEIGALTPNDGEYNWANDISNYGIDFPEFTSVTSGGEIIGGVRLDNLLSHDRKCNQTYQDIDIEVYLAQGNAQDSTIEGTDYLGNCSLDSTGSIASCDIDASQLYDGASVTSITVDKCGNTSEMGQAIAVEASSYDYGDAPNEDLGTGWGAPTFPVTRSGAGARHVMDDTKCLTSYSLTGSTTCSFSNDADDDGQPNRLALGDLSADTVLDYDDGVLINPDLEQKSGKKIIQTNYLSGSSEVVVENTLRVTTTSAGYISVWLDLNQDGQWQTFDGPSGQFSELLTLTGPEITQAGTHDFSFSIPSYAVHGESWLRVRFSSQPISEPHGLAVDGEVEDYQVWIAAPSISDGSCSAGIQNPSFEHWTSPYYYDDEFAVPGWNTIPNNPREGNVEERNQLEFDSYRTYDISPSPGNDFNSRVAELNAHIAGTLYQDVVTRPGQIIRWSFDYIARKNDMGGEPYQQLSLLLGSSDLFDRNDGDLVQISPLATNEWKHYTETYVVPEGQYITRLAFKAELPSTGSVGNIIDNVVFGCEVGVDFGDLPKGFSKEIDGRLYDIADNFREIEPNLYIGSEPADAEIKANYSAYAKGDDADGFNDEFTFSTPLYITKGNTVEVQGVPVKNATVKSAVLKAYIDINGDGSFSKTEEASVVVPHQSSAQHIDISWDFASETFTSDSQVYLRLELSGTGDSSHIGEIEDHLVYLVDDNIFPQPGRCDGFVQVKETGNNGVYQYAKWKAEGGEIVIDEINGNLNVSEIKAIGVSQADGMTYGVGAPSGNQHELYIASQEPNAEFTKVTSIKAAFDGVYIESSKGHRYTFNAGDTLDAKRTKDHSNKDKLGRANAGDVSPDGRYMLISRASWRTIVRIDLATGTFDTIQLKLPENSGAPWSADFAFDLSGESPGYVYGLAKNLQHLYKISVLDGSYSKLDLNILLPNGSAGSWPKEDQAGKLASGGFGINKGGILFAMTNGGLHDLNQDGVIDDNEKLQPSTALYSVDIANHIIHFEMKGEEETTTSNDAGGCSIHADYGDVPEALEGNNPATHLGTNESVKLGGTWSADLGPGYDELASSDLSDDGVVFKDSAGRVVDIDNAPLIPGKQYSLYLNVSGGGSFTAWVSWDAQHWNELPTGLDFTVPMDSSRGYVRVRYSSKKPTTPYGEAPDGEVEDYSFEIGSAVKGLSVNAPSSPLTCEVAQYQVTLDVEGGNLSQDVNVNIGFENAPSQCWFDASAFNRGQEFGKALCSTGSKTLLFQPDQPLTRTIWVATDSELDKITLVASEPELGSVEEGTFFVKTGFKIVPNNVPAHYKAGETFGLRVERKVALDDEPQCMTDPDYEGAKTFNFAYETDTHKGKLFLGKAEIGDSTPVTLNFSSGVSDEISSEYFESGYLNVLAEYTPEQGDTKSASLESPLHFKPYSLVVSDVSAGEVSNPADSFGQFIPAETEFSVQVTAVAKGHTASEPLITQNFDAALANSDGFLANVVVPSSQVGAVSDLSPNVPNTKVFSQGRLENTFEYGNVGTISTHWSVDSYDGYSGLSGFLNTQQSVKNGGLRSEIGYFYPAKFSLTSEFSVPTTRADNGEPWTYYGRSNVNVALEINALGANDSALSFYDADVLEESELPSLATSSFYFNDDLPTCLNDQGVLLDSSDTPIDFAQQWQVGRWSLVSANYYFGRAEDCWQQLDDASLLMDFTVPDNSLLVDDNGTILENEALALGQNIDVRFGRLTLVDVAGPTNQRLPVAVNIEYWDGEGFMVNDWHSEPALSVLGAFPELDELDPQPMELSGAEPVIMEGSLELNELTQGQAASLIGGSEPGRVALPWAFSQGAENWLGYCWYTIENEMEVCGDVQSYQQPPISTATFGVSRGSDNVIYIMERFE